MSTPTPPPPAENVTTSEPQVPVKPPDSPVLSGADKFLDGQTHFGVSVLVTSDGKPSTLMIPDVTGVAAGTSPVYITKPIRIDGKNLKAYFVDKGLTLPDALASLIDDTKISCEAFYFTKTGPMLMMFALKFDQGLIKTLTGDEALGKLFDVQGASVRILRCPANAFSVLQQYVAELSA